jgi:hypothetical protein
MYCFVVCLDDLGMEIKIWYYPLHVMVICSSNCDHHRLIITNDNSVLVSKSPVMSVFLILLYQIPLSLLNSLVFAFTFAIIS